MLIDLLHYRATIARPYKKDEFFPGAKPRDFVRLQTSQTPSDQSAR